MKPFHSLLLSSVLAIGLAACSTTPPNQPSNQRTDKIESEGDPFLNEAPAYLDRALAEREGALREGSKEEIIFDSIARALGLPTEEQLQKTEEFKTRMAEQGLPDVETTAALVSDEEEFIVVNIASQMLHYYAFGQEVLRSKVIVGAPNRQTPRFVTTITGVKLNPDWNAPAGGGMERRYSQLIRNGEMEVFETYNIKYSPKGNGLYRIYQPPGPDNVLGQARFIMYSRHHVYLHDTNRPDLFNLEDRAISNGCIRVEKWDVLTADLLGISVDELMVNLEDPSTRIEQTRNIPVHMIYWTGELVDGLYQEYPDIYGLGENSILN